MRWSQRKREEERVRVIESENCSILKEFSPVWTPRYLNVSYRRGNDQLLLQTEREREREREEKQWHLFCLVRFSNGFLYNKIIGKHSLTTHSFSTRYSAFSSFHWLTREMEIFFRIPDDRRREDLKESCKESEAMERGRKREFTSLFVFEHNPKAFSFRLVNPLGLTPNRRHWHPSESIHPLLDREIPEKHRKHMP